MYVDYLANNAHFADVLHSNTGIHSREFFKKSPEFVY